ARASQSLSVEITTPTTTRPAMRALCFISHRQLNPTPLVRDLAGVLQHVVQRGNNRLSCFLDDGDRQRYLRMLGEWLLRYGCLMHAYVLMTNHVHLLLTPAETGAVSRLMQTFGRN